MDGRTVDEAGQKMVTAFAGAREPAGEPASLKFMHAAIRIGEPVRVRA
jgi:hypothetical protein